MVRIAFSLFVFAAICGACGRAPEPTDGEVRAVIRAALADDMRHGIAPGTCVKRDLISASSNLEFDRQVRPNRWFLTAADLPVGTKLTRHGKGCRSVYQAQYPEILNGRASLGINMDCGDLCGGGVKITLRKVDERWVIERRDLVWLS